MKLIRPILVFLFSASAVVGETPPARMLPESSAWNERSIQIDGVEFPFRVTEIDEKLEKHEIVEPPANDHNGLMKFVSKFLHEWEYRKKFKRLSGFFDATDTFQEANERFRNLDHLNRSVTKRSYTHLIEREGFFFLLGVKHKRDGTTQRVIGTYFWKKNRFYAVLDTPEFQRFDGHSFRKVLGDIDMDSMLPTKRPDTPNKSVEQANDTNQIPL